MVIAVLVQASVYLKQVKFVREVSCKLRYIADYDVSLLKLERRGCAMYPQVIFHIDWLMLYEYVEFQ